MGVQLKDILAPKRISLEHINGHRLAIDAFNTLYQFLTIIRKDGMPLMDSKGKVTSHISGLLYRTAKFVEAGIQPCYVFDGSPPDFKLIRVEREKRKKAAEKKLKEARERDDLDGIKLYSQQATRLEPYMIEDSKKLLTLMGIPWIQAPSEGEAQATYMASKGDAWAVASQDFDALLFGAPRLVRNLTITGRRKIPRKDTYIEVVPELIELELVLSNLNLKREELVCLGILVGTDYNPGGIKGIGPKKALSLVKEKGRSALDGVEWMDNWPDRDKLVQFFMEPPHTDDYELEWCDPDPEGAKEFLVHGHDFLEERVNKVFNTLQAEREKGRQEHLSQWF